MRGAKCALKAADSEWWSRLPFRFDDVQVSRTSRPEGFRLAREIVNIEAVLNGRAIQSCGESATADGAMTKAIAELVERIAMIDWSTQHPSMKINSNGWAAHDTREAAKKNAVLELIERDGVLANWFTQTPFDEIDHSTVPIDLRSWVVDELSRSEFPRLRLLLSTQGLGPSVTCLLVNRDGHGVSGHATRSTLKESVSSAITEACRAAQMTLRKDHWLESIALRDRSDEQVSPGAHAVYYAYHEAFPEWIFGKTTSWHLANEQWNDRISKVDFDAFDFCEVSAEPMVVGFASHPSILPLRWGTTSSDSNVAETLNRRQLNLGYVRDINLHPHIVA